MKQILIVGTVAYDEIETPTESSGKILGGAGTYISLSASLFDAQSSIISIVGGDFQKENQTLSELPFRNLEHPGKLWLQNDLDHNVAYYY